MRGVLALLCLLIWPVLAQAQSDTPTEAVEDNSMIVRILQEALSSETREIKFYGIDGLLASNATVEKITISDQAGIWLTIEEADIVWSRLALLSGRLKIDSLGAREISLARLPQPDDSLPTPEATPFSLPELPVSVEIGALDVAALRLGEPVLGQDATLKLAGRVSLIDGALDADIALTRRDGPGGSFEIKAAYANETRQVTIDVNLAEPADGLVANIARIKDRPGIDLSIKGAGPVDDLVVDLRLATDNADRITGQARLRGDPDGIGFAADLSGRLDLLVSGDAAQFFAGESRLSATGLSHGDGGLRLDDFALKTGALDLTGAAETTSDGFLKRLSVTGGIGDGQARTILPLPGGATSLETARIAIDFGGSAAPDWTGAITVQDLRTSDLSAAELRIDLSGTARDLDLADKRRLTFAARMDATGLRGANVDLSRALGQRIVLDLDGAWSANAPLEIARLAINGNGLAASASGTVSEGAFEGTIAADIARLRPFAGLAGRDLGGALSLQLAGRIRPLSGSFDLSARGQTEALRLGVTALDPLLVGTTFIQGQILRNETGLRTRNLSLRNPQIRVQSDGIISSKRADLNFAAELADLALLSKKASGTVRFTGSAIGADGDIRLQSRIGIDQGALLARDLSGFSAGFSGRMRAATLLGRISGLGQLGDDAIILSGDVVLDQGAQSFRNVDFRVGPSTITASVDRTETGALSGNAAIASADISGLAALFLQKAAGAVTARLDFQPADTGQQIAAQAQLTDVTLGAGARIGRGSLDAVAYNAFGVPDIVGSSTFADATFAGIDLATGTATATVDGGTTLFSATSRLKNGANFDLGGALRPNANGFSLALDRLTLERSGAVAALDGPARFELADGEISEAALSLRAGSGRIDLSGRAGEIVDLSLKISALPVSMANIIYDQLDAEGAIDGDIRTTGSADTPDMRFSIAALGLTTAQFRASELPPIDLTLTGDGNAREIRIAGEIEGPQNFSADVTGTIPIADPKAELDLAGAVNRFPLEVIDPVAGRQGLRGRVDGTFGIAGQTGSPRVRFDLTGRGLSATAMRENGMAALNLAATGSYANDRIILPEARITGPNGIDFTFSGRMPLRLDGLNVAGGGTLPLSVGNVAMAKSGLRATGVATVSVRATGRLSAPQLDGNISLRGGSFVAPLLNLRLNNFDFDGNFIGNRFNLRAASAQNSRGGSVSATGFLEIDPLRGLPADFRIAVADLRYTDGQSFTTNLNSNLTLSGPLTRRARLSGQIEIGKTEITIPEREPKARAGFALNLAHENAPAPVLRTLARAGYDKTDQAIKPSSSQLVLDIEIAAPNQIFVRGRGLDGELGGRVKLDGTAEAPSPVGTFDLIRGRMNVLGRRVEMTSGQIAFSGDLAPIIALRARSIVDDIEATISLDGPVLKPKLSFSSVPGLPDDEILARVIFGRSLTELSPLQIARIASAIAELSGRSNLSIFDQVRQATGLDDLDFQTSDDGLTTLRAGKYIRDNVYSSIEADDQGNSKVSINLDINPKVKARGTVDSEGNTSLGVFFEKDY